MKKTIWGSPWDPWNDRKRRERESQQRRERAEKAARKVRERLGDGPMGKVIGWLVQIILSADPSPRRDP